jgi:hypothetical protein
MVVLVPAMHPMDQILFLLFQLPLVVEQAGDTTATQRKRVVRAVATIINIAQVQVLLGRQVKDSPAARVLMDLLLTGPVVEVVLVQ